MLADFANDAPNDHAALCRAAEEAAPATAAPTPSTALAPAPSTALAPAPAASSAVGAADWTRVELKLLDYLSAQRVQLVRCVCSLFDRAYEASSRQVQRVAAGRASLLIEDGLAPRLTALLAELTHRLQTESPSTWRDAALTRLPPRLRVGGAGGEPGGGASAWADATAPALARHAAAERRELLHLALLVQAAPLMQQQAGLAVADATDAAALATLLNALLPPPAPAPPSVCSAP